MSESEPSEQFSVPTPSLRNEPKEETPHTHRASERLDEVLSGGWHERLQTESFEDASHALQEVTALREWRAASRTSSFRDFYKLVELVSTVAKAPVSREQKTELREGLADRLVRSAQHSSPRISDLYMGMVAELEGSPFTPQFDSTTTKLEQLRESGDLQTLFNPNASPAVKLDRIQKRLEGYLKGSKALDRRERRIQNEEEREQRESADQPTTPPPASDESKPNMDEMERSKEGEQPPAIWTISTAYGGYFKEQSFDTWDAERNVWRQSEYTYEDPNVAQFAHKNPEGKDLEHYALSAEVHPGKWCRVPIPYTMEPYFAGASPHYHLRQDQNGDYIIHVPENHPSDVAVLVQSKRSLPTRSEAPTPLRFPSSLSSETQDALREIVKRKHDNLSRARALASYTMRRLTYSNDSSFNQVYNSHENGYVAAIDEHKQADCDVANTYFAALCAQLNIPVRHVVGHMVKGKDTEGNSRITSGTGHAWSEVWNDQENTWTRVDATPPGDPQLDEDQEEGQESAPGDYGAEEAIGPTDEQLEELKQKLEELTEKLSYTQDERELAEATGIEMKEARDIMREIQKAEDTRLPNGERVVDVLSQLFSLIIEARKTVAPDYSGPLRKREGGEEIDDIVSHKIGIRSGVSDPASRRRSDEKPHVEQVFGGFDVHMIGDKSGSMSQTVEGESKWELQRRAEYLILSSLNRFEQNLERAKVRMTDQLSVRTQAISFRGSSPEELDEDKPLSAEFAAADKVRLWRSLTNQGGGNGDVQALQYIYSEIVNELGGLDDAGAPPEADNRLRMVIACSDGYPDSVTGVHQMAQSLGALNTVVVGVGLTETAAAVEHIYDTPYSRGDIARDINDLPAIVAKHLVQEAIKLFPERSKESVSRMIETIVAKFDRVQ